MKSTMQQDAQSSKILSCFRNWVRQRRELWVFFLRSPFNLYHSGKIRDETTRQSASAFRFTSFDGTFMTMLIPEVFNSMTLSKQGQYTVVQLTSGKESVTVTDLPLGGRGDVGELFGPIVH